MMKCSRESRLLQRQLQVRLRSPPQRRCFVSSAPPAHDSQNGSPKSRVIFSGIQPTGTPHIGNYLGALQPWKKLHDEADANTNLIFCIVDLHAITTQHDAALLRARKREMLAALLAIGLHPSRCTLFYQSSVPAHSELQWILSCQASTGYLSRMTQWKTKLRGNSSSGPDPSMTTDRLKHGLFSYPILQAADVLVHRATHVPVGEDQRQHLEFARECVTNFHASYPSQNPIFPYPETLVSPARRVMSLRNPSQKMSKSAESAKSRIDLTDDAKTIRERIAAALTDDRGGVTWEPEARLGVTNLLEILAAFGGSPEVSARELAEGEMKGVSMRGLKEKVAERVAEGLGEIQERYREVRKRGDGYLDEVAEEGRVKAARSAEETMRLVREAVGLGL